MKIRQRLALVFSALIVGAIGITALLTLRFVHSTTIALEVAEMRSKVNEIDRGLEFLHEKASQDIVFALKNPLFVEYFQLPETRAGNKYVHRIVQFSDRQQQIRSQLEQWLFHFQARFNVDEACLIDRTGQEHARIFNGAIEPIDRLSSAEAHEPFFFASFEMNHGQVHIEYPYLSSDTHRWVFAYTSPIVLDNGDKPAFFHFEMPISLFQDRVATDTGRISVIDPDGYLVADTKLKFGMKDVSADLRSYFPPTTSISSAASFTKLLKNMKAASEGYGTFVENGETYHVVFKRLMTFDWILAYVMSESAMMAAGDFSVNDLKVAVVTVVGIVMTITILTVFFVANRIARPIVKLRDVTNEISKGDLDSQFSVKGDDEIHDLANSFQTMAQSLKKTIELEKRLAVSEQMLKETKLAAMGSVSARLAHDLRNLLSTIKTTVELIKGRAKSADRKMEEQYRRLDRAIEKMTFQINSVMDFVRTNPLHVAEYLVDDIIDASIGEVGVPEGVEIRRERSGVRVTCDGRGLEVVMTNLIANAVQAIGSTGEIVITVVESGEGCVIEVQDSGPGIPEELVPRIFEPLFTTKADGTGLGLVSCKSIVSQHGGSLAVFNNPTRFVVTIPTKTDWEADTKGA